MHAPKPHEVETPKLVYLPSCVNFPVPPRSIRHTLHMALRIPTHIPKHTGTYLDIITEALFYFLGIFCDVPTSIQVLSFPNPMVRVRARECMCT